jgi:integrase/recombinase XerD
VDAYLTHLTVERRLAANSVESYARDLGLLQTFAAGREAGIETLGRPDLEELVRGLMADGRSPRSVARAVACFRGFYRFLVVDGRLKASPADDLHPPRAWKVLPRFLAVEDVDRLMAQPDVSTPRGLRDRALIELLYATGMRVSELLTLRPADVNLDASYLTCTGKGDKERIVPFGDEAAAWPAQPLGNPLRRLHLQRAAWDRHRIVQPPGGGIGAAVGPCTGQNRRQTRADSEPGGAALARPAGPGGHPQIS